MRIKTFATGLGGVLTLSAILIGSGSPASLKQTRPVAFHRNRHVPVVIHQRRDQTASESYNWSGYAVTGSKGSVTDVKGSWIVPQVDCSGNAAATPNAYAAFWVGIDGWTSNSVEQIGTDSDCVSPQGTTGQPTYYAWFEFYPQDAYYIGNPDNSFKGYVVEPGDLMSAEVKAAASTGKGPGFGSGGQKFTVTIADESRGWSFSITSSAPEAQQTSAEWIAEAPYGCNTTGGFCELSNFATLSFSAASATVGSTTQVVGGFGSSLQEAIMVSYPSGASVMAQPSALASGASGFQVTWFNPGP